MAAPDRRRPTCSCPPGKEPTGQRSNDDEVPLQGTVAPLRSRFSSRSAAVSAYSPPLDNAQALDMSRRAVLPRFVIIPSRHSGAMSNPMPNRLYEKIIKHGIANQTF
ncbi:hypothetical protein EDD16DRAFT_1517726 [Pisolithus croceorrhizus]|nr:hypothetical protein EDD16DRAFT_1517726 [Pisolithus croceorrhizus]KAI6150242.1 hypothetical protein EDD17DRAFT_1513595 [Pisolithus thermaeus]